jgi:hypothetical protein
MEAVDVLDVAQPLVDQAEIGMRHGVLDAAAVVVTAQDHVLDFEDLDCVLEDAEHIEIGVHDHIGDVTVHE